jgi:hypothetical protein
VVFANPKNVEPDQIRELNLFEKVLHALNRLQRKPAGWVGHRGCKAINANLHNTDAS